MRLAGKAAIITGGASGFGRASAIRFAREGAQVMVVDLNGAGASSVCDEIQASGGQELDTAGDGFFVVFDRAHNAVEAAIAAQRALAAQHWPEGTAVRVRMGLHTG